MLFLMLPFYFLWASLSFDSIPDPLPVENLSLNEILKEVDQNYPLILRFLENFEAQKGVYWQSLNPFIPQVNLSFQNVEGYPQLQYYQAQLSSQIPETPLKWEIGFDKVQGGWFPAYYGQKNTGTDGRWKFKLTLPLLRDLIIDNQRAEREQQKWRLQAAQQAWRQTRWQARWQALQAYWRWFSLSQQWVAYRKLVDLAQENQKFLEKSVKLALNAPIDLVENQKNLAQRKGQLWVIHSQLEQARWQLGLFRLDENREPIPPGRAATSNPTPLGAIPAPKVIDVNKTLDLIPALKQLKNEIQALEVRAQWARMQRFPRLDVVAEHKQWLGQLPPGGVSPYQNWIGLEFSVPLINFWGFGQARQWTAQLAAQQWEYWHQRNQWKMQLEYINQQLQFLHQQLYQTAIEVETTQQLSQAEERKFRVGTSSVFLVNVRQQEAALALVKWWDLWAQYQTQLGFVDLLDNWLNQAD